MKLCNAMSDRAVTGGWVWAAFQYLFLPSLLFAFGAQLGLSEAELNGIYYILNFCATVAIFRRFLGASAAHAARHLLRFLLAVVLGFCVSFALTHLLGLLLRTAAPEFVNANDAAVLAMYAKRPVLIFVGTVVLVPVAEECLFRGLIFGRLRPRAPVLAWVLSVAAFAFVHVMGYIGSVPNWVLLLCAVQYVVPGLCLAWSYERSGSVWAPIAVHAATNAAAFLL